ncbi:MAG: OadG family protein [Dehalococcoidia bacterium]|nr:MAG: OadG family protein [Dehalococcoidia bacterium]
MEINWVEAWQISGIGFGLVFVILAILAVVTWLFSLLLNKKSSDNDQAEARKKE